jgi:sterol desaturase/sphingolipid hydroxylase (fatty acid hydroxylase superfamily)
LAASPLTTVGYLVVATAGLALVEAIAPLARPDRSLRTRIAPNLALTLTTLGANLALAMALVPALAWEQTVGAGLLNHVDLPPLVELAVMVLVLDLGIYGAHVAMHAHPLLWRFHRVHHGDPTVDVTTTIRQHPGEAVFRCGMIASCALALGVSPGGFAIYQALSAAAGLLEHANVRLPRQLNEGLALVVTWPDMHKVHHSRDVRLTNTNYGNLVSFWDRLFGTFTPAALGREVTYGLDDRDAPIVRAPSMA